MRRVLHVLNCLLLLGGLAWNVYTWDQLPGRIPAHFGLDGQPDRWTAKGADLAVIYALPLLFAALLYGAAALVRRYPALLNVPRKAEFLALPPEARKPVFDSLTEFFAATAAALILLFTSMGVTMQRVAWGLAKGLEWHFLAAACLVVIVVTLYVVRLLLDVAAAVVAGEKGKRT